MITVRAGSALVAVCVMLLMGGCSREQQDWRSAESTDTVEAYDRFIQKHPESELTTQARARVAQLGEERDWQRAGSADNVEAYRQFLAEHPNGKWAQEARIRIENFSLSEQAGTAATGKVAPPVDAGGAAGSGARGAVAATPATGGAKTESPRGVPPSGTAGPGAKGIYAVQLGAFKTEAAAQSQWRALKGRFGADLGGLTDHIIPADTASGRVYRLQASVSDEARARALCESLRKRSQPCVAVLPN